MKTIVAVLLILHGLITVAIAAGSFNRTAPGVPNPASLSWWPVPMGRSWLLSMMGERASGLIAPVIGVIWLLGGVAIVAAGMGRGLHRSCGLLAPPRRPRCSALAYRSTPLRPPVLRGRDRRRSGDPRRASLGQVAVRQSVGLEPSAIANTRIEQAPHPLGYHGRQRALLMRTTFDGWGCLSDSGIGW